MTADQYVLWFIAMVVAILVILVVGTLGMAGLLRRADRAEAHGPAAAVRRRLHLAPQHHRDDHVDHAA